MPQPHRPRATADADLLPPMLTKGGRHQTYIQQLEEELTASATHGGYEEIGTVRIIELQLNYPQNSPDGKREILCHIDLTKVIVMSLDPDDSLRQAESTGTSNIDIKLKYRGISDIITFAQFLKYFHYATNVLNSQGTKLKLFIDALSDDALLQCLDNFLDIDDFKEVIAKFETVCERHHQTLEDFNREKLGENKDFSQFYLDKLKIGKHLELNPQILIQGLPNGMPLYVRRIMAMLPIQTIEEWMSIARSILKKNQEEESRQSPQGHRGTQFFGNPARAAPIHQENLQRQYYSSLSTIFSVPPRSVNPQPNFQRVLSLRPAFRNPRGMNYTRLTNNVNSAPQINYHNAPQQTPSSVKPTQYESPALVRSYQSTSEITNQKSSSN